MVKLWNRKEEFLGTTGGSSAHAYFKTRKIDIPITSGYMEKNVFASITGFIG